MLRINQQRSSAGAKSYFQEGLAREDYYTQDAIIGRWGGKGAERLGLVGDVQQPQFLALCDNRDPNTGEPLTARTRDGRTVGYDFNFHAPKSLSLLYTLTRDRRLLTAFEEAVRATMAELEADVKTRVRVSGANDERVTGNLVFAEFVHLTSRPVGGVPDPHLHAHCFVFNATYDGEEERFKAGQFRDVVRDAPYFEAAFHARLSRAMTDLGLEVERTRNGWEVAGLSRAIIEKFSRRTAQIEDLARELGIHDAREKAELGAKTRERKEQPRTLDELRAEWKARLAPEEKREVLAVLGGKGRGHGGSVTTAEAVSHSLNHSFERASVMPRRRVLAEALKRGYGSVRPEDAATELGQRHDVIRREWDGQAFVTTREALAEEAAALHFVRSTRGTCAPLAAEFAPPPGTRLNTEQSEAVRHVLTTSDRVSLIRGAAGTGKTTLTRAAAEAIRESGHEVRLFAPTTEAAYGVLRKEGFENAETVARLLVDRKLQESVRGSVLWIDEAGLLGTRDMAALFRVAEEQQARVVLMGDERQHASVPRGDAFRLLQTHAGLPAVSLTGIRRQRGEYKAAVEAISNGDVSAGFERLDRLGAIREAEGSQRHELLAADYLSAVRDGKSALVVAPTHREGEAVTARLRVGLKTEGTLGPRDRSFAQLVPHGLTEAARQDPAHYHTGDVVRFHQNVAGGFRKGEAVTVSGVDEAGRVLVQRGRGKPVALPLASAKHFDVYERREIPVAVGETLRVTQNGMAADGRSRLLNGTRHQVAGFTRGGDIRLEGGLVIPREFGHVTHGYCVTSHASQGKTVDRVFVAVGPESFAAASAEQFYVSVSRGREEVRIYCEDKRELLEAVSESRSRPTATELTSQPLPQTDGRTRTLRHGEHIRRQQRAESVRRRAAAHDTNDRSATLREQKTERGHSR